MNEHAIKEDILKILHILSSDGISTQRNLSSNLGFSLGKTNYLLKSLAQKGLTKISNFTCRQQKLKKVKYILTKKGLDQKLKLTYVFLQKKEKEYLALKEELERISHK